MFDDRFARIRDRYRSLLLLALGAPKTFIAGFLGCVLLSFALWPFLGENFFPAVDSGQILMHVLAQPGTRIEETERVFGRVEDAIREIVPENEREMILDNMGLTPSFTVRAYIDNGTVSDGDGEILVTTVTNIGWTPIFPRAAAVVTDVGAPLSHAAIVARELGIPAVVGCGNATMRLHTGDRVRVDGSHGTVEVLHHA